MGDRPEPLDSVPYICLLISDMQRKPGVPADIPQPGNGFYTLDLTEFGHYEYVGSHWRWIAYVGQGSLRLIGYFFASGVPYFYCDESVSFDPADEFTFSFSGTSLYFTGCQVRAFVWNLTNPGPRSWNAAFLIGVPEQVGYFAEEFPATSASRFLRYASHFFATNLKLLLR